MNGTRLRRLGAALVVTTAACTAIRSAFRFEEPEINLQRIEITGLGLTGGSFDLVLDVHNPNGFSIKGTRVELGLDLEGTHFGDALVERAVDLPARAHSQVTVPVRFEWAGVGAAARALLSRQAVAYTLSGAVLVQTPGGEHRVGVRRAGDVPLSRVSP